MNKLLSYNWSTCVNQHEGNKQLIACFLVKSYSTCVSTQFNGTLLGVRTVTCCFQYAHINYSVCGHFLGQVAQISESC